MNLEETPGSLSLLCDKDGKAVQDCLVDDVRACIAVHLDNNSVYR